MESDARNSLFPRIAAHLERLVMPLGGIPAPHRDAGRRLAEWVTTRHRRGEVLPVVVVCTGNSRRSMLGAMMGNAAASYLGIPELRFFSAGTTPSAFNPRTVNALRAIGFEVDPLGDEAPRGPEGLSNSRYLVRWGTNPDQQLTEFSKAIGDPALPAGGFAALMVCEEASAGCPVVPGADVRIPMSFVDPKSADGMPDEESAYADTRDAIGLLLMASLREGVRPSPDGGRKSR